MSSTSSRARALEAVKIGDVIFGIADNGKNKLLLVYDADESRIFARHVTTGTVVEFGRDGVSIETSDGGRCTIVSTAALPAETHAIAIGLDRKMSNAKELTDLRLSEGERHLLLTVHEFFKAHPLPDR